MGKPNSANGDPLPERPRTPPSPSSTVPFLRDPDYVDRHTLLEQIRAKCSIPGSRTALVGLGGVGKPQLAIEYSYQIRNRSLETWVFWVYASNAARLEQSYREIADRLQITGRKDPQANIFKLVHSWLYIEKRERWLLILDNIDDHRDFNGAVSSSHDGSGGSQIGRSRQLLSAYLPQSHNGSILITTRSMEVALRLVEQRDIIAVEPMDKEHGLALFKKKLGGQSNSTDMTELVAALEFMPLAIVQAAAYITQMVPRCSVKQYFQEFQKSDRKKMSLLNHKGGHLRRDWGAKPSTITTWQISFEHIHHTRQSAANLLSLISFFDPHEIPEALVRTIEIVQNRKYVGKAGVNYKKDNDEDSVSDSIGNDGFEDDILILKNYSFISVNTDKTTFEMHSLVQLAIREWLGTCGPLERWKQQFIKNLSAEFLTGEYKNWEKCQSLFPYAKSAIAQQPDNKTSLEEWASLLYKAAWYAWSRENVTDAEKMSVMVMKTRRKLFGKEQEETLSSMEMVGLAYSLGGRWQEAVELHEQVMEMRKMVLGAEHPHTLKSMGNVASTSWSLGRWKVAEELDIKLEKTMIRVLCIDDEDTLTSMGNIATNYRHQGRCKEAEELDVKVMEMRKKVLGAEHPHTLKSMSNLSSTYRHQGRWKEAEKLDMQLVETRERVLGANNPDTLTSMNNLATTFRYQGRWKKAEELGMHVIEMTMRVLGIGHPDRLAAIGNLAFTYKSQGRHTEALELMGECVQLRTRVLGIDHPDTISSSMIFGVWKAEKLAIDAAGVWK